MITSVAYSPDPFDAERPFRLTFTSAGHVKEVLLTSEEFATLQSQMFAAEHEEAEHNAVAVRWDAMDAYMRRAADVVGFLPGPGRG